MKVLIIKLGALGDVILATPFIQRIQQQHADAEVYLLTTPAFSGLFKNWPHLRVQAFPRTGFLSLLRAVRWIRSQRFDVCYDLQSNDRSWRLLAACGIPRVVASRTNFPATHYPARPYQREVHIFERLNAVMAAGGLAAAEPKAWLPVSDGERAKVEAWLAEHQLSNKPFVVMHAHASPRWQSKRWPYFAELAAVITARGMAIIWAGAGSDAKGNRLLASRVGVDASNAFSINELVALASQAKFAVTNDSGPMHVFSCADIPVYAFFGPTNPLQSHAVGQAARVLSHPVACSPCLLPVCPADKHHECLQALKLDEVVMRLMGDGMLPSAPR